jgi:hypothetical protein
MSMQVTIHLSDPGYIPDPTPPREPAIDVFHVDGGCSQIFVSTRQGAAVDVALMVDALRSIAPPPLRGPPSIFLSIDGGHSRIYSSGTSL